MSEIPPALLQQLLQQYPWLLTVVAFIGTARLVMKPIGGWLKDLITRAAQQAIDSKQTWDDHWVQVLLGFWLYRLFAFLLDLFVSVKLPVAEDLTSNKPPL